MAKQFPPVHKSLTNWFPFDNIRNDFSSFVELEPAIGASSNGRRQRKKRFIAKWPSNCPFNIFSSYGDAFNQKQSFALRGRQKYVNFHLRQGRFSGHRSCPTFVVSGVKVIHMESRFQISIYPWILWHQTSRLTRSSKLLAEDSWTVKWFCWSKVRSALI